MATVKVDSAWTSVTAGQNQEFWRLANIPGSHVNKETFQNYLEGKNSFPYDWIVKGGRIYFEVRTLGLTANDMSKRLITGGHIFSDSLKDILSKHHEYDENHRYIPGMNLKIVLIRVSEIRQTWERTTLNFKEIAEQDFCEKSVSELKSELGFLIREKLTVTALEEMGLDYIAVPHYPLLDSKGRSHIIVIDRYSNLSHVDASWDLPKNFWNEKGAFAFLEFYSLK